MDAKLMTDEEIDKRNEMYLIAAALAIGFEDLGNDNYKCNKDQLTNLIGLCIKSALDGTTYE